MFQPGAVLYFTPFHFENGNPPKNKYFIVLSISEDDLFVASLPTKRDHVPSFLEKKHGCINNAKAMFNCYCFINGTIISECGSFSFPKDTFVYGERIDTVSYTALTQKYVQSKDYEIKCILSETEFNALKSCIINSCNVKRKVKRILSRR